VAGHISKRSYKRKDGSKAIVYRARIPNPHGVKKTDQIEKTFKRKADAERWLIQQGAMILSGSHLDPRRGKVSFAEVARLWESEWMSLEAKTQEGYRTILNRHLLPAFGTRAIGEINRGAVQAFIADVLADRSPKTVRNVHVALSACFAVAVRHGLIALNPAHGARLPKTETREMMFLTAEEVRILAESMKRPDDRLAVYVAGITGLRAGEQWALRRRDIDLDAGRLRVTRSLKELGNGLEFGKPKTRRAIRAVSLPPFLVAELRAWLGRENVDSDAEALVFTAPMGGPVRHSLMFRRRTFTPAVAASLPHKVGFRWHDLRHTAVALAIDNGAHVSEIMARMGHSSVTTTIDRYGHLMPNADGRIAAALDGAFSGEVVALGRAA
jgi:integrase